MPKESDRSFTVELKRVAEIKTECVSNLRGPSEELAKRLFLVCFKISLKESKNRILRLLWLL
jgi:hypothetical protein